jgi:hypothetical protein
MSITAPVWVPTTFSQDRDRPLNIAPDLPPAVESQIAEVAAIVVKAARIVEITVLPNTVAGAGDDVLRPTFSTRALVA